MAPFRNFFSNSKKDGSLGTPEIANNDENVRPDGLGANGRKPSERPGKLPALNIRKSGEQEPNEFKLSGIYRSECCGLCTLLSAD